MFFSHVVRTVVYESITFVVIEDAAEAGAEAVTAAFGDHTKLVCTPLRSYEGFAEHVLGVEKTLTVPSPHRLGNDGRLYWLHIGIEYRGKMDKRVVGLSFHLKLYCVVLASLTAKS